MPTPVLRLAALVVGLASPPESLTESAPSPEPRAAPGTTKPAAEAPLPPEVAAIDFDHRASLVGPMDGWQLAPVRARYESLLKRTTDPVVADLVRARLDLIARQDEVSRSARAFRLVLERSRRLDRDVAATLGKLGEKESPGRRPFVAEGLIQPSSRQVEGRRVYALIGRDGEPVAYLDVPPGLDARPALAKRVGVRGSVRYNEALGARLIAVKDLEPLE